MSYINELREKRGKAIADARALLDHAKNEKRDLSEDEQKQYDGHFSEQEKLEAAINREQRQVELDRQAAEQKADEGRQGKPETSKPDPMRAFGRALTHGVRSLSDAEVRALSMDDNPEGGYLVPPVQWVNDLIQAVDDMVHIRQKATVYQLSGHHSLGVPSRETDVEDATWGSEISSVNEDTALDFGNRELQPHQLNKLVKVSMKLLQQAPGSENIVRDRLAYKFGVTQEKGFLTGSGASQPLGVFTASNDGIGTGRDVSTGNTTTAIGADNLREVKYSLKGQYHSRAEWIFHRDAIKAISKLKDGEGQYLWQPGITVGDPDRLLGMPVNMSEFAPNTFTTGLYVGILGDFSQYWIAESMMLEVQRLNELYAANSQVGFIGRAYCDGMPVLAEAFARVKLA